jgi:hypothetical protein
MRASKLYSSPNVIRVSKSRKTRWMGHVERMRETGGAYRLVVGKPEEKRPFGKPRRRWENYINIDFQEIGWAGVNWIVLAQNRD